MSSANAFDCCKQGYFHKGTAKGSETKIGAHDVYVTGSEQADKAVLIVADVFGWDLINTRVLADKYAEALNARVYLPDYFHGESLTAVKKANPDKDPDVPSLIKKYFPRDPTYPIVAKSVADIRAANPSHKKIGAIGFCWGAPSVLYVGSSNAPKESQVDAVAFAHPSVTEVSDFEHVKVPGLYMCCEIDGQFPKEKQEAAKLVAEKTAKENDVFSKFVYFPRVSHGWSIKGDAENAYTAKAMRHAAAEAVAFFGLELSTSE